MTALITLNEIERLKQLYTAGFHDTFLNNALHKIIERQIDRDEADLRHVNETLRQFEQQYDLASNEFQQRFQAL